MAFSLSNWFKGKSNGTAEPPADKSVAVATPAAAPAKPKAAPAAPVTRSLPTVRKVVPNSVQPVSLRDPGARGPVSLGVSAPAGPGASRPVTSLVPPRKISFGNPATVAAAYPSAPEAFAPSPAPEPDYVPASVPDVAVNLEVGDFIDRLPATLLADGAVDRARQVEFRSSELYSDLTKGRASVPASVIYEKCPELFSRPVSETEDVEVALPLAKLVEQLTPALQTRADQVAEENVGEIETPFLQVAMEDNARLPTAAGTTSGAIRPLTPLPAASPAALDLPPRPLHRTGQIQTISAPKVPMAETPPMSAAPTAQSIGPINPSKRPPSTVRASVAGGKIRLSGPTVPNRISLTAGPAVPPPPAVPFGVPILNNDLPPSATQRIATSMPPLPTAATSPSHQVTKKTQRIQIPPISLRSPANPSASPVRPPSVPPPSVPVQSSPVTVRQNNGDSEPSGPVVFRSLPPPPSVKPTPPSFAPAPTRPPGFPPPAFPATPPLDASPAPAPVADDRRITLGLAAVLRGLSSSLLAVEPSSVPAEARITLPFALVEPQMRTGRVSVPRAVFVEALPEGHKDVLDADADLPEVPLPLQEVFQNLPSNALTMRPGQMRDEITHLYPTPFSQKAEEDAQRLGVGEIPPGASPVAEAAPIAEPAATASPTDHPLSVDEPVAEAPAPAVEEAPAAIARDIQLDLEDNAPAPAEETPAVEAKAEIPAPEPESNAPVPAAEEKTAEAPAAPAAQNLPVPVKGKDSELQVLFMTEDELDAKSIVRFVSQMPGIDGCAVMFGDGLRLAGNFPDENQTEGFSAMAPPFFKRAKNFAVESGLGSLQAFTLFTDSAPCSFLMHDDICLAVRHSNRGFMPGVREKLDIVVRELARMYSN